MQFTKAHGCGNDFIVVDARENPALRLPELVARAPRLCERRFGVGADGVLWVSEREGRAEMTVINADGSLSEMCGNGLRCVAHHLLLRGRLGEEGEVLTGAGALTVRAALTSDDGRAARVTVWMGHPRALGARLFAGAAAPLTTLSMGNPHAVSLDEGDYARRLALAEGWAREVEGGVNLSFARVRGEGLELHVHERGCGWTLACGTGACAAVVAATARGLLPPGRPTRVSLPGGALEVRYEPEAGVWMTGPAEISFHGSVQGGPLDQI